MPKRSGVQSETDKALNDLGNASLQKGQINDAIAAFQKAIAVNPSDDAAQYIGVGQRKRASPPFVNLRNVLPNTAVKALFRANWLVATVKDLLEIVRGSARVRASLHDFELQHSS